MDRLRRWLAFSLRTRFILGVAVMLFPLVLLGTGAFLSMRHMAAAFEEALGDPVREMHAAMHLQVLVQRAAMPPNDYLIHAEPAERERFSRLSAAVEQAFEETLVLATLWPEQKVLFESAQAEWRRARRLAESLLALPAPIGNPQAAREMKRLDAHIDRAAEILARIHTMTQGELDEATAQARAIERQTLVLVVSGVGVLGLLIAVGSGLLLARFVLMPLHALEAGANRLRAGDLSHRVSCALGDELGQLADAFNAMADKLEKTQAELKELASHDGLTGLYNHRMFHTLLAHELARGKRFNRPLSLLMIDIDHFKHVNDMHGHLAGDAVLKELGNLLLRQARAIDRVCRYGGEEIIVILPETENTAALNIAERLRAVVEREQLDVGGGRSVNVTVSIGLASWPAQASDAETLVAAADTAMYAAKQAGRNRVCRYEKGIAARGS